MVNTIKTIRFDYAALGFMGVCIVSLYALVLGDMAYGRLGAVRTADRSAAGTAPSFSTAAVLNARWTVAPGTTVESLNNLFERVDFQLDRVRGGELTVPRVLVERVPDDLADVESPTERKRLFIQLALPMILYVNEHILADRGRVGELRDRLKTADLVAEDRAWLDGLFERYGVENADIRELLRRIDVIPPSLALAQGAEESGWGTSRFVREGNAIFGQRTFVQGNGIVPERRNEDEIFEVKRFDRLVGSVYGYMMNLNTHPAYRAFRRLRAYQRDSQGDLDGYALAGTLMRYSERGVAYIETIRTIMRGNRLSTFDRARLGDGEELAVLSFNI